MSRPPWNDLDDAGRADWTRRRLAILRRAWPALADPPKTGGGGLRTVPDSKPPVRLDTLSLRAEIARDVHYWAAQVLTLETPGTPAPPIGGLLDELRYLTAYVDRIATWRHGERLAWELGDLADEASRVAWPRTRSHYTLGPCPNTVGVDGVPTVCGTIVRANGRNPVNVKCRGCGLVDTIDGWILRIVGDEPLVTAEQLVPILHKRLGRRVTAKTISTWVNRGELVPAAVDDRGRNLYDRHHAFLVITRREGRRGA